MVKGWMVEDQEDRRVNDKYKKNFFQFLLEALHHQKIKIIVSRLRTRDNF